MCHHCSPLKKKSFQNSQFSNPRGFSETATLALAKGVLYLQKPCPIIINFERVERIDLTNQRYRKCHYQFLWNYQSKTLICEWNRTQTYKFALDFTHKAKFLIEMYSLSGSNYEKST